MYGSSCYPVSFTKYFLKPQDTENTKDTPFKGDLIVLNFLLAA
jgi:hypothetical protein